MSPLQTTSIDLSCDIGEGGAHDAELMPLVTSANIACGGHAGDNASMAAAVKLARRLGVGIGAHPGHADREHFGRRELTITPTAAARLVEEQIGALTAVAGERPRHVKLHGGLYHQVAHDATLAAAVATMIAERWPRMILFAPAGSQLVAIARGEGLFVAEEAFLDRAYRADGSLVPRSQPGAVIHDPVLAAERGLRLVREGFVAASDGMPVAIRADTLCIHGDGGTPVAVAAAIREALAAVGIAVRPPDGWPCG